MTDIRINLTPDAPRGIMKEIAVLIKQYPGDYPLYISIPTPDGERTYKTGASIDYCAEFYLAINDLLGDQ